MISALLRMDLDARMLEVPFGARRVCFFTWNSVKAGTRASSHGHLPYLALPPQTHLTQHSCCQTYLTPAAALT